MPYGEAKIPITDLLKHPDVAVAQGCGDEKSCRRSDSPYSLSLNNNGSAWETLKELLRGNDDTIGVQLAYSYDTYFKLGDGYIEIMRDVINLGHPIQSNGSIEMVTFSQISDWMERIADPNKRMVATPALDGAPIGQFADVSQDSFHGKIRVDGRVDGVANSEITCLRLGTTEIVLP